MKKLKNMVAVIVCLSVMLTVPAHAQLTSTEHGWLESIKNSTVALEEYVSDIRAMFSSTQLARNPIAYYTNAVYTQLQSFQSLFQVGGRVDDYLWDFHSYLNSISNGFISDDGYLSLISKQLNDSTVTRTVAKNLDLVVTSLSFLPYIGADVTSINSKMRDLIESFDSAFDATTHGTSKDIYSMLFEAYEDLILPADTLGKTIYELLYDMHTELGGYEEGSYGLTLYGTLDEQLKLLKLREPIWEFELEEFLKNKDNYDQIEHIFTNGQDTDTSLGMGSIRALGDLLSTTNSDLKSVGSVDDFITNWEAVNADGDEWFSIETQNALDTVSSVVLFFDDEDPYNMNGYMERWGVLTDVIR